MIEEKVKELAVFCKENNNVHKEVKRLSREIKMILNKVAYEWTNDQDDKCDLEEENRRLTETIDSHIEKIKCGKLRILELEAVAKRRGDDVMNVIMRVEYLKTIDDFKVIAGRRWDNRAYGGVTIILENPTTDDAEAKVEPDDRDMERGVQRLYKHRFPELSGADGEFEVLEQETRRRLEHGIQCSRVKLVKVKHAGT